MGRDLFFRIALMVAVGFPMRLALLWSFDFLSLSWSWMRSIVVVDVVVVVVRVVRGGRAERRRILAMSTSATFKAAVCVEQV